MNYDWWSSYRKDSFHLKQEQALGFLDPVQILDTIDQLSSIVDNQWDVGAGYPLFFHLHATLNFLHPMHYQTIS